MIVSSAFLYKLDTNKHICPVIDDLEVKKEIGSTSHECKGTWQAVHDLEPTEQHIGNYTVSFRRQYAYVYCVICRPCGIIVDGKFFSDSEFPTEVTNFILETFPTPELMPNTIL